MPTAGGACYTLTFPTATVAVPADLTLTIDTTGVGHVAFFAEHVPTEFERDTHYLMSGTCADAAATWRRLTNGHGGLHRRGQLPETSFCGSSAAVLPAK